MREIVIDTETTGLDPLDGHRIVEMNNCSQTGQTFHCYLCPERSMPADAVAVHGLTAGIIQ
jgi:DNA polymerase III subunit epsilon